MKIKTMLVPPENDTRFENDVNTAINMFGGMLDSQFDKKTLYNVLKDYVEVSISGLDDLPQDMQEAAEKYIKIALRRFVFLLASGIKMSALIGPRPLEVIDTALEFSEEEILMLTIAQLSKLKSQKQPTKN